MVIFDKFNTSKYSKDTVPQESLGVIILQQDFPNRKDWFELRHLQLVCEFKDISVFVACVTITFFQLYL